MIVFPMAQDPARENLVITIVHIGDDAIFNGEWFQPYSLDLVTPAKQVGLVCDV